MFLIVIVQLIFEKGGTWLDADVLDCELLPFLLHLVLQEYHDFAPASICSLFTKMSGFLFFFFFFWSNFFFFFSVVFIYLLLYNIVLVLPYIDMNLPWVYTCSPS